jgi:hypothetical protein
MRTVLSLIWDNCWLKKDNSFTSIIGGQGSGKSMLACYLSEMTDVDRKTGACLFDPETQILFRMDTIIDRLNKPRRVGEALIIDEAEMNLNALNFQKEEDKDMANLFSTIRAFRQILFLTLPNETQLNKTIRSLRKYNIEMLGTYPKLKYATSRFEILQPPRRADTNWKGDKFMKRSLPRVFINQENDLLRQCVIKEIRTPMPSKYTEKVFLKKKIDYLMETFDVLKDKYKSKIRKFGKVTADDYVKLIEKNSPELIVNNKVHAIKIKDFFGITSTEARAVASYYNDCKKGQRIEVKKDMDAYKKGLSNSNKTLKKIKEESLAELDIIRDYKPLSL